MWKQGHDYTKKHWVAHFKWVDGMVCELYQLCSVRMLTAPLKGGEGQEGSGPGSQEVHAQLWPFVLLKLSLPVCDIEVNSPTGLYHISPLSLTALQIRTKSDSGKLSPYKHTMSTRKGQKVVGCRFGQHVGINWKHSHLGSLDLRLLICAMSPLVQISQVPSSSKWAEEGMW